MNLRDQVGRDEGLRLMPYRDSRGYLTIGYGRCLDRKGISRDEADLMLGNDLRDATESVKERIPFALGLGEVRFAVLVNMAYNLGIGGLMGFRRFLEAVDHEDWSRAAAEMLDSRWARQVGNRAIRLATQMETNTWQ